MVNSMKEDMENQNFTVILANGEAPRHAHCLNALRHAAQIICCDGAINKLEALGFRPDWIIGDLDSIDEESKKRYADRILPRPSEEICDLHKAINYCKEQDVKDVIILGAMGLREDHALANLSLLLTHGRELSLRILTDYGIFTPIFHTTEFDSFAGQQVSVFNFSHAKVSFSGLRYPVVQREFHYFWEGSLNEALGEHFTIGFDEGEVLVYQAF